ncbi:MAG: NYN domain-containing protein [Acidimicrobiales bacterium]
MNEHRAHLSRKLVLVDIENLLFGAHARTAEGVLREQSDLILQIAQARRPTDQLVVGCNPRLAFSARAAFPTAQLVTRIGADGADMALIEQVDSTHAAERFTELCIVSGDNAFADVAHEVRQAGMLVRVVAPRFGLSAALRLQSDIAVYLPNAISQHPDADEGSQAA